MSFTKATALTAVSVAHLWSDDQRVMVYGAIASRPWALHRQLFHLTGGNPARLAHWGPGKVASTLLAACTSSDDGRLTGKAVCQ